MKWRKTSFLLPGILSMHEKLHWFLSSFGVARVFHCGYVALGNCCLSFSSDLFSSLRAKRPRRFRSLKKTPEVCVEMSGHQLTSDGTAYPTRTDTSPAQLRKPKKSYSFKTIAIRCHWIFKEWEGDRDVTFRGHKAVITIWIVWFTSRSVHLSNFII